MGEETEMETIISSVMKMQEVHTDKDGKVYRLTYDVNGVLICVEHLY